MINQIKKILVLTISFIIILCTFFSKTYALDTEYIDDKIREYKGLGIAVIDESEKEEDKTEEDKTEDDKAEDDKAEDDKAEEDKAEEDKTSEDKTEEDKTKDENKPKQKKYYYLYYDETGRVHILQYVQNEMRTITDAKWIFRTDADTAKAKELGAKESYKSEEDIQKDENKDATKLFKEIAKENKIGHLYDYVAGSDTDLEPINFEDLVFNRISIFDVNVFKDTAGGRPVKEDSAVGIIRNIIATWYVALRNVAFVVLVVLIIYYGIRLAISTVAAQKAEYKRLLFGWIKSFLILIFLHWIMYLILYFNDYFIAGLESINQGEREIYNTIKTRAFQFPWQICIPATIVYITLFVMLIRFLWVYIKRTFTVMFLIILGPLVIARYAIESASGKGSDMVVNWFKKFFTAVFLQTIHALSYVIFVGPVLIHSLDSVLGTIISLFFLNFMITADTIFINVFKSRFEPKMAERLGGEFKAKDYFTDILAARRLGQMSVGVIKGVGGVAVGGVKAGYRGAMNYANQNISPDFQENFEGGVHKIANTFENNTFRRFNNFVIRHNQTTKDKLPSGKSDRAMRRIIRRRKRLNSLASTGNRLLNLKQISRKGGKTGEYADKFLKLKLGDYGRRLKAGFKIIKDTTIGAGEVIFMVPMTVVDPEKGIIVTTDMFSRFSEASKTAKSNSKLTNEQTPAIDDTIKSINNANIAADKVEELYDQLSEEDKKEAKDQLKEIEKLNIDSQYLEQLIRKAMAKFNIIEINEDNLDKIVDEVVDSLPSGISRIEKVAIKARAVELIKQKATEQMNTNKNVETTEIPEYEDETNDKHYDYDGTNTTQDNNNSNRNKNKDDNNKDATDDENNRDNSDNSRNNKKNKDSNSNESDESKNKDDENSLPKFDFAGIIKGIQEATIEETIDNKFAEMAMEINEINDINKKEIAKSDSKGEVININRFIDSL